MIANEGYVPLSLLRDQGFGELEYQAKKYLLETLDSIDNRPSDIALGRLFDFSSDALFLTDGVSPPVRIDPVLVLHCDYNVGRKRIQYRETAPEIPDILKMLTLKFNFGRPLQAYMENAFTEATQRLNEEVDPEKPADLREVCNEIFEKEIGGFGSVRPGIVRGNSVEAGRVVH